MKEKWFRFRSLGYAGKAGKVDYKVEIFAPTVRMLKEKLAFRVIADDIKLTFSHVDRVEVEISKDGKVSFSKMLIRKAIDGNRFVEEVLKSETYKRIAREFAEGEEDVKG